MTLKPDQWKPGMTVISRESGSTCVLEYRDNVAAGWDVDDGAILDAEPYRPATYADLSREPVEGERAVSLRDVSAGLKPGDVVSIINGNLFYDPQGVQWHWYGCHDRFAPLTPLPDAEHPLKKGLVSSVILNEKPTPPAKCSFGKRPTCAIQYITDRKSCDPCQPCALLIDLADYWCAWYAEHGDRCRTCGFRSCAGCER